jgi:hypothetical protein
MGGFGRSEAMQNDIELDHTLITPYVPVALYFEEADIVEYVRKDAPCVHQRIDGFLTLMLDLETREPIGFALKGFKHFYLTHFQPRISDDQFVLMTSILEEATRVVGNDVFRQAYDRAIDIASKDHVKLSDLPKAA